MSLEQGVSEFPMKKKICLVIPSLHAGGMERVMSELASYFCTNPEIEVHLLLYGIKPEIFYHLHERIILHKPHFVFNNNRRIWYSIKTMIFLRKKVNSLKPDTVLSFGEYWNSFVLIALYGLKFRVFVSDRCQPDKSLGGLHNFLRRYLYPRAAGVIIQTEKAREIYQRMIPGTKLTVIGNPIRSIGIHNDIPKENIILSVGRLIRSKHHDELIRLFVAMREPGWKLIIIGDDAIKQQNKANLQALIKELKAEDKVVLTGSVSDVDSYYKKSKIFAFTSSSEGFPNVIGEAMSAGIPVIAFDCVAGPAEIITDGYDGILVPLYDYNLYSLKLKELMNNTDKQKILGINAITSIKKFDAFSIGEKYLQLITNS